LARPKVESGIKKNIIHCKANEFDAEMRNLLFKITCCCGIVFFSEAFLPSKGSIANTGLDLK